ncbi:hypothetical protein ANCDUO_04563 [Ancylostoma duodenale]|uniref:G-protein coupled receptors family 1 profile domain-containing protein n=1 Tax=Ancylostoma duodenale TaxID=51022 RepID=A0A0C2DQW9_9BILA|nr:hypothetical protein ANCDUO_04563 [Ancylostoma duodenale]
MLSEQPAARAFITSDFWIYDGLGLKTRPAPDCVGVNRSPVSLSVRSVFIGCLAVSDLLMSLTSLPWTAVTLFTREWIFPKPICKLIGVFQTDKKRFVESVCHNGIRKLVGAECRQMDAAGIFSRNINP